MSEYVRRAIEMSERDPLWQRLCTKTISSPNGYIAYKCLPLVLLGSIRHINQNTRNGLPAVSNVGFAASVLEQHNFPTYYASRLVLEAMQRSHPPKGIRWNEMRLPFPAMTFMIPRGMFRETNEDGVVSNVVMLGYALLQNVDTVIQVPGTNVRTSGCGHSSLCVFWVLERETDDNELDCRDTTFPLDMELEPDATVIDAMTESRYALMQANHPNAGYADFLATVNTKIPGMLASRMTGVIANLILLMEARKNLVEPVSIIRPGNAKKHKLAEWAPTWIGRNYQVIYKGKNPGTAHYTELDWRAGHYRRQHFGTGGQDVKTIWIEPYIAAMRGLEKEI